MYVATLPQPLPFAAGWYKAGVSAGIEHDVEALFERYGAMVFRRAQQLLGNRADAEEATQEIFIKAMRNLDGYAGRGSVAAWLYRIATHYCLNQIRDRSRRRALFREHVVPAAEARPAGASPSDLMTLRWLLANADEQQARAAVYVFLDGMSYSEAAVHLGVAKRTVGNLVQRFRVWAQAQLSPSASETAVLKAREEEAP